MTDISVKDDPEARAFVLVCDEQEVGRISYADAFERLKRGIKPPELIRQKLEPLEWAMGITQER